MSLIRWDQEIVAVALHIKISKPQNVVMFDDGQARLSDLTVNCLMTIWQWGRKLPWTGRFAWGSEMQC